jgi:hypothetical protein
MSALLLSAKRGLSTCHFIFLIVECDFVVYASQTFHPIVIVIRGYEPATLIAEQECSCRQTLERSKRESNLLCILAAEYALFAHQ